MRNSFFWAFIVLWLTAGSLGAQDVTFTVSVEGPAAGTEEIEASLLIDSPVSLVGWWMAVCHDGDVLTATDIEDGSALDDVEMFLNSCVIHDEDEYGITCSAVVSLGETLDAGLHEIAIVSYDIVDGGGDDTVLEFCELGSPAIGNFLVDEELNEIEPELVDADVPLGVSSETFEFTVSSTTVGYDTGTGEASFTVAANIVEHEDSPGNPNSSFGFSMSLSHDEDVLSVTDVVATDVLNDLREGDGPAFFAANLLDGGFTLGVVYSFDDADITLAFGDSEQVVDITYDTVPDLLMNNPEPTDTRLRWSNAVADPQVDNVVVYNTAGDLARVHRNHGLVTLVPGGALFLRGDCNANARIDIGDGIGLLRFIFADIQSVVCEDACDANDSGGLTLGDGLRILNYLFVEGDPPAAPFPDCGGDATAGDDLECAEELICD